MSHVTVPLHHLLPGREFLRYAHAWAPTVTTSCHGWGPMSLQCMPHVLVRDACAAPCVLYMIMLARTSMDHEGRLMAACGSTVMLQKAGAPQQKESLLSLLLNNVLKNPYIWGMALTYFFIYVVRQGVTSWFVFYLIKVGLP